MFPINIGTEIPHCNYLSEIGMCLQLVKFSLKKNNTHVCFILKSSKEEAICFTMEKLCAELSWW